MPILMVLFSQLDVNDIVERHKITPMKQAVSHLDEIIREWISLDQIPEVEWSRMRALELQEALRSRNELAKQLDGKSCLECTQFKDHVSS